MVALQVYSPAAAPGSSLDTEIVRFVELVDCGKGSPFLRQVISGFGFPSSMQHIIVKFSPTKTQSLPPILNVLLHPLAPYNGNFRDTPLSIIDGTAVIAIHMYID